MEKQGLIFLISKSKYFMKEVKKPLDISIF